MSQRRSKKDLSIMDNVDSLTDQELRAALKKHDVTAGPITDSTRNIYKKKLASIIEKGDVDPSQPVTGGTPAGSKQITQVNKLDEDDDDDDDTSDEDFNVREEDLDEEFDEEDEFDDDEEEELMSELQDDANLTFSPNNTAELERLRRTPASATGRLHRILFSPISFFILILLFYLVSSSNFKFLEPLKPFKNILKQIFILAALSTVGYVIYKTFSYYRTRRNEENKRVCDLVVEALELLQSPDNPKSSMPVLHIRDTLFTPAERKSKKMMTLWTKAVKFIEEHESRVKVELANIDGEDFRAWKWIGSKKL